MKKKLLVFGCSYADKSYVEITTKSEKLKDEETDTLEDFPTLINLKKTANKFRGAR